MEGNSIFASRVKQFRTANGLTQQQLGEAVGLSKQAINDIEQGRRETTITKAIMIARLFSTTVHYLMGDTDDPARPSDTPYLEQLFGREELFKLRNRLKFLREEKGVSDVELGKITFLGTLAYRNLEGGEKQPHLSTLIALADYFDVSLDYLVGRSDDPSRR